MRRITLYLAIAILMTVSLDSPASDKAENGPTIQLCCKGKKEPIANFMYFVPLISPVSVTSETSKNSNQSGYAISCEESETKKDSFFKSCEFRMEGKGSHINNFDHKEMIERNKKDVDDGAPIKNILGYIKFEGEGYGKIEIYGEIDNGAKTVTRVDVHFDARSDKSPVTAGLYSVKSVNGKYEYENSYNPKVARINALIFRKSPTTPKMQIDLAAVGSSEESLGFWARITGKIANFFIDPIEITELGNEEMLKLGLALYEEKAEFTFPKAKNLKAVGTQP
jgi:hypothetical protein